MTDTALRVLHVEDDDDYAALVEAMLARPDGGVAVVRRSRSIAGALPHVLDDAPDCILVDLELPDAGDLEAVAMLGACAPDVPIVVLTGREDTGLGLEALAAGAEEVLAKSRTDGHGLARAVRFSIERKRREAQLGRLAHHDALTGLANRWLFSDRLTSALARERRGGGRVAVLFCDLVGFKAVNDRFGHAAGDQVLVELAARMTRVLRPTDTIARHGGDEFTILCEDAGDGRHAELVADRVRTAVRRPIHLADTEVRLDITVGTALSLPTHDDPERLLRDADRAMYRCRSSRRFHREALSPTARP